MIDELPPELINYLHETAKLMVRAGFQEEFSNDLNCRRKCLEECLINRFFGLQKINIKNEHQIDGETLDIVIERWITASEIALKILFPCKQ